MKTIKLDFAVGTTYAGSEVKELVEIEVEDGLNKEEIEKIIEEEFETWVWENVDSYWKIRK